MFFGGKELTDLKCNACERCLRQMQRAGVGAAVEKRKDQCEAPAAFFGHRKSGSEGEMAQSGIEASGESPGGAFVKREESPLTSTTPFARVQAAPAAFFGHRKSGSERKLPFARRKSVNAPDAFRTCASGTAPQSRLAARRLP